MVTEHMSLSQATFFFFAGKKKEKTREVKQSQSFFPAE
jgi:hypothetical protein